MLSAEALIAYQAWVTLAPYDKRWPAQRITYVKPNGGGQKTFTEPARWEGSCCSGLHFETLANGTITVPKPDHKVCPREQAWRTYIQLRDQSNEGETIQ